jgi:putative ABC transport system permease protein
VKAWAPRVRGEGLASSPRASVGVRVVGVDRNAEPSVSLVPDALTQGDFLPEAGKSFIGEALAKRLKVKIGQKLVVSVQNPGGDLSGRPYRVAGVFRTASTDLDENTIYLSLSDAQDLFGLGAAISEIVLLAHRRSDIDALRDSLAAALGDDFEAHGWEELQPLLVVFVESFDLVSWYVYGAVFVAMAFGIANVLLMAVYERTREIGMMMALGMKRGRVVGLVALESLLVTSVGVVVGFAVAAAGLYWLRDGIEFGSYAESLRGLGAGTRIVPQLRSSDYVIPLVISLVVSLLASGWPALRAARLKPGTALRHV